MPNVLFYDFSIGWGDCWSGWENRYIWHFKVNYTECSVEYLGNEAIIYDSNLPEPVNCYITYVEPLFSKNKMDIKLYPNPTYGKFIIVASDIQRIDIYNIKGDLIKRLESNSIKEIDLSNNMKGLYILKIMTGKGMSVKKIILK